MNNAKMKAFAAGAVLMGLVWFAFSDRRSGERYTFHDNKWVIFLVDNKSGEIYRYYRNATNNVISSEGFQKLVVP